MSTEIVPHAGTQLYRQATDAAGLCKEIVLRTAKEIQGRKFVPVEGWQAIAVAHGCVASAGNVERIDGGFRAIGRIIRTDTGQEISSAEGFVGDDEQMWLKRPEYARRAMAQTRAISRACRSAFAHVVVMMNAGLQTTPAEEMEFEHTPREKSVNAAPAKPLSEKALKQILSEFDLKGFDEAKVRTAIGHNKPWTKEELNQAWARLVPAESSGDTV